MSKVKYPNISVQLTGKDGNAFVVMGAVVSALQRNKVPQAEIDDYKKQSMAGDYNHLLAVACEWVEVL